MTADGRLTEPATDVPGARTAWALSLAGALPFVAAAAFVLVAGRQSLWFDWFVDVAMTYGAVILSFTGGIRWGAALRAATQPFGERDDGAGTVFAFSVVPSLAGWLALMMEPIFGLALLAAAFAAQGVWDAFSARGTRRAGERVRGLPVWFARLRVTITFIVVASLLATMIGVA